MMPILDVQGQAYTLVDSGVELLVNGDFSAWTGVAWNEVPTGYAVTSPGALADHVTQSPVGQCRLVATSALVQVGFNLSGAITVLGGRFRLTSVCSALASGNPQVQDGSGNVYQTISAPGTLVTDIIPAVANTMLFKRVAYPTDVTMDSFSLRAMLSQTPNVGSAGSRLLMGDGLTPATLPTRTPNTTAGFSFNGSQYLKSFLPISSGTYSVVALLMNLGSTVNNRFIFDCRQGGGTGYMYLGDTTNTLISTSGTIYVDDVAATNVPYGSIKLVSCCGMTLSAPSWTTFGSNYITGEKMTGNILGLAVFPGTLTPRQLRDVKNRLMARCWT